MGRTLFGVDTRIYLCVAFVGGITPDIDHLPSPKSEFYLVLHEPFIAYILIGLVIASIGGLVSSLVLGKRN